MAEQSKEQVSYEGVSYETVGKEYFEKRSLRKHARVWSLWALGVAAVISGEYSGWNFGLGTGGFGGLLIAGLIITVMYVGLCYSIAEMAPAMPHTGGAYSFGRSAMGPWGGFITGLAENMEYVLTPAVVVVFTGGYLGAVFGTPPEFAPVWWAIGYVVFVGLNIWGVEASFRFTVIITFISLILLAIFFVAAIPNFDFNRWALNIGVGPDGAAIELPEGGGAFLPFGLAGIAKALPFAIWFYLAIEQLPLASEEAYDPKKDMPKGILLGILTLIIFAVLVLFLNSGIAPGAAQVGASNYPVYLGFQSMFGDTVVTKLLGLVAVAGLIASFHTIIYAYGRNIYSLSRAGYLPRWLSVTHKTRKTPHVALVVGGVIGYIVCLILQYAGTGQVGAALLNMAVFGAVIAYIMQAMSFIMLRRKLPNIERPYISPIGIPGAAITAIIAAITLITCFANEAYRPGVYGTALWFLAGLVYFALIGRHKLVYSPEEDFAVRERQKALGHA